MKVAESRDAPHEGVEQACGNDKKKKKKSEWVRRAKKKKWKKESASYTVSGRKGEKKKSCAVERTKRDESDPLCGIEAQFSFFFFIDDARQLQSICI